MDDNSTIIFNIFFNRIVSTFQEIFRGTGQQNYTIIDLFNKNCTEDLDCQDTALFCNATSHLCQCATFHSRNEKAGICEFQQSNLTRWLKSNTTLESWGLDSKTTSYQLPLSAIFVMILSAICILLCGVCVCLGGENKDNGPEVLRKEQKESHQIEMPQ